MTGFGWRALVIASCCFLAACSTAQPASFAATTSDVEPDGWTGSTGASWTPPENCPISVPNDPPFVPPPSWPETPSVDGLAWFGTDQLWTVIDLGPHTRRKSVWWSSNFPGGDAEPTPDLEVVYQRTNTNDDPIVFPAPATNAFTTNDSWFMINGIEPDQVGCWQATATYKGATLTITYEIR